jgi:branched-chain amino acid transport system permease protein
VNRLWLWLAGLAALAAFPWLAQPFYAELMTKVMIMAIFAMSLDLLVGRTGLVSFGHAAYFGLGAYTVALLSPSAEPASLWLTLPAAVLVAMLAAFINGYVVLRTKGLYFIMATLAFAQMLYFLFHDTSLGGGSDGRYINFKPEATLFDLSQPRQFYYFVLALLVVVTGFLALVLRSPFGRALAGIKANEQRMHSLGFRVARYKLGSFTLAGALAGLAGYLFACQYGYVNPDFLSWKQSGDVLLMIILGGVGRLPGAFAGALAFIVLQEAFSSMTKHWQLAMGLTIIALVLFLPGGLASLLRRERA